MERSKGRAAAADGKSRAQVPRLEGAWLVLSGLTERWVSDAGALGEGSEMCAGRH